MASLSTADNDEVAKEFGFWRMYKDGRVEMCLPDWATKTIPPSIDPVTGVQSKDVTISTEPLVSVRIFLPKLKNLDEKLALLFYVHGGGFSMMSAFQPDYHNFCSAVAAEANVIVVSVEYGLFPARPIPACYDDSWAALQWVASHVNRNGPEKWLNDHTDFEKVFIGGDSAGGNISHTLAFRAGTIGLPAGVKVVGLTLVHPFFGGTKDDDMWLCMCPENKGSDDPRMNPTVEDIARLGCEKVLIFVAEKDHLNVVGKNYFGKLKKSGWKGNFELVENDKEEHCFHLRDPYYEKAMELKRKFVSFLRQE
ncbi:probable carboxylesterase 5 [Ricinus communis]|uniref:Arylacetamide deacetylase, putative n=1 Tax=Ricinus communis TaxID=3988 RepID=B9SZH3_RICCO|nr:probable carboxylesterase 5 [Ricinus communis]EEF30976.1 Arylacetamide deacetylase, putative [Ricinus communis]|eukprot:XP_002531392.1 probable carboxylesterase 5 [Ricinus communis]